MKIVKGLDGKIVIDGKEIDAINEYVIVPESDMGGVATANITAHICVSHEVWEKIESGEFELRITGVPRERTNDD